MCLVIEIKQLSGKISAYNVVRTWQGEQRARTLTTFCVPGNDHLIKATTNLSDVYEAPHEKEMSWATHLTQVTLHSYVMLAAGRCDLILINFLAQLRQLPTLNLSREA